MRKSKAMDIVKQMPENFQVDDLIEKLIFMEKVEEGLKDIEEGKLIDHTEIIKQVSEWSKK